MKYLITFTIFFIIMTAFLLGNYNPPEEIGYSAKDRKALSDLMEKSQEPAPVLLQRVTALAYLYPDYANDKNPKSLPNDWHYRKH